MSLLGVAVPLNHEHEGLSATAAGEGPPTAELCPCTIKVSNRGTDLALPLAFWGQKWARLSPAFGQKGHYRTTELQGWEGFISDGCPMPLGVRDLPGGCGDA